MFSVFALIVAVVAAFVPAKNFARSPSLAVIKSSPVNIDFAALDDALDAPTARESGSGELEAEGR